MQVVDYLVIKSLEVNNRCLRYLAECDPVSAQLDHVPGSESATDAQTVYAESLLARESRRLVALWALVDQTHTDLPIAAHQQALERASELLSDASALPRLALRLASIAADDAESKALLDVTRALPDQQAISWGDLNDLFAADSLLWRGGVAHQHNEAEELAFRAATSYRKACKLSRKLSSYTEKGKSPARWFDQYGMKFSRWVQHSAHQMELFRPGLSEKGKAQVGYAEKLADSLRMRRGFLALIEQLSDEADLSISAGSRQMALGFARQQLEKMDKRILRLLGSAYKLKPKKMVSVLEKSLGSLGIQQIATISPAAAAGSIHGVNKHQQ